MRKTHELVLRAVGWVMVLGSGGLLIASVRTGDWCWFQRGGSLLVVVGVGLTFRRLLRLGVKAYYVDEMTIDGGHIVPTAKEIEEDRQRLADVKAAKHGMFLAALGTFIWGWGDLLGDVLTWIGRICQRAP